MNKRAFLFGAAALGLSGCSVFRRTPAVPVSQEGFIVRETPVAQNNMTAFLPEGDTIYMSGSINEDTATGFAAVRDANPKANRLVILQADGPSGSPAAIGFGRAVRAAGFRTHLRNDSVISGGAVDAFLGGTQRTIEEGAVISAVRGSDVEAHKSFDGHGWRRWVCAFCRRI